MVLILNTRCFGRIEIQEEGIIEFPKGLPAFEEVKKFVILSDEDPHSPFKCLQCVDDVGIAFTIVNPFLIKEDYDFEVNDKVLNEIQMDSLEDIEVFSVVVIPEDIKKMSMNLRAPLIINHRKKQGLQVILDTDKYNVRHYIIDDISNNVTHSKNKTG
jgi:flagellar assembly factor FliW